MLILLGFAILAGAGTALSPCALPVLPALLSAGGVGGRRRPLGIVLGLSITFTVTIVGLASVVDGVGLGDDPLRDVAIAVLLVFGVALLMPDVAARLEAPLSRLARFGPRTTGDGFLSGLLVGGALGFVYTPCASPILAAVISVSAASGKTIAIAIAYAAGSAVVLLLLALGGRRVFDRVRKAGRGPALQRGLGAIMILTAVAITTNLDVNFDQFVAEKIPNVNLTASLECSKTVTGKLHEITGRRAKFVAANGSSDCEGSGTSTVHAAPRDASQATLLAAAHALPVLGTAPEFTETEDWFNTPGDRPLTLPALRGRVVLVDFWTYTCINCIRTLPYLKAWNAAYAKDGLTIVGVETPEFAFEKEASNVSDAIGQFGLRYPVVQDNNMGTWNAYGNEYWPADYLIDAKGQVRYATFGEGDYDKTETAIRALLAEAGYQVGGKSHPTDVVAPSEIATPETYMGTARGAGLDQRSEDGHARLRPTAERRTAAQRLRLQRHVEDRRTAGRSDLRSGCGHGVQGQERVPGAELARRTTAAGAGAARRASDRRRAGRRRRPRQRGDRPPPAPVLARLAAGRPAASALAALRRRRDRLRLHVRLAPPGHIQAPAGTSTSVRL